MIILTATYLINLLIAFYKTVLFYLWHVHAMHNENKNKIAL